MKKKILGSLVAVAALVAFAAPAQASCLPDKLFGTWDFTDGVYYYVTFAAGSAQDPAQVDGRFWQPGLRPQHNEGTQTAADWLKDYGGGTFYVSGALGRAGVVGCPSQNMILTGTDPTPASGSAFFASWANENAAKANAYDYPDLVFAPIPAPRATASSSTGTGVAVDLAFNDPAAGFSSRYSRTATEAINEIVLYQAKGSNPGPAASGWTVAQRFPYGGGETIGSFTVDCTDGQTTFLAAGLNFTGELDSAHVSSAISVSCSPTLADPDDKFDLIRERGKGEKRGKPFREN